ncbi:MAG: hypothetical protein KDJ73_06055 [Notoacmeibacter sp.]|nr:hypothetical protein [Notoacmeibacter sp.]MCC0033218.1 hypothetical protein [Brucellaceae bacterium]
MEILFAPFGLAIGFPVLILLPAALFAAGWWFRRRSKLVLATAMAWLAYFGWELMIHRLSPGADIRVDLLLIAPLLLVLSVISIVLLAKGTRNQ